MSAPKVSVSIITYNQRDYIAQAIDSALAQQTNFPVRIHIGDDCSNDGTRDILTDYRDRHPDTIVLNLQPKRPAGVPGRANNIANLESCEGEYVAMLDGDDYWTDPYKLQRQVDFLEAHPGHSGAAHDSAVLDMTTGEIRPETLSQLSGAGLSPQPVDIPLEQVLDRYLFQTSSFVFRRRHLRFPKWFESVYAADFALYAMLAAHGPIRFVPETWSTYRQHPGSIMGRSSDADWARRFVHDWPILFAHYPDASSFEDRTRRLRAERLVAIDEGRYAAAAVAAVKLLAKDPASLLRFVADWKDRRTYS